MWRKQGFTQYPLPNGNTLKNEIPRLRELVEHHKPTRMLVYGCGLGRQFTQLRIHVAARFEGELVLYQPGYPDHYYKFAVPPVGLFHALLCSDYLEYQPEHEIPDKLAHMFSFVDKNAGGFVFLKTRFRPNPDGRLPLVTHQTPQWWIDTVTAAKTKAGIPKTVRVAAVYI